MNITDLIVEFIKDGNIVEFPGLGTLASNTVSAHHDPESGIYYPARRTVAMTSSQVGNKAIVRRIAESECVTVDIAEMIWKNYVDALSDKLQRDADGHEFPGIGTMRRVGNKVSFAAVDGLDLDADKRQEQPLENVATYTPKVVEDPFAAYEGQEPEPEESPVEEVVPQEQPQEAAAPVETATPSEEEEEEKRDAGKEREAAEPKEEEVEAGPESEPDIETVRPVEGGSTQSDHLTEVKRMLDEIPASPKTAKEARRAEKEAAKAAKEARKEAEKKAALLAREKEAAAREAAKELHRQEKAAAREEKKKRGTDGAATPGSGKKKRAWLWILIVLLLLLAGGGAYYLLNKGFLCSGDSYAKEVEWSRYDASDVIPMPEIDVNMLNMLEFNEKWVSNAVDHVHVYMSEYVHEFLRARHYSNAYVPMMNSIDQYAGGRLQELMVPGMSVKRFLPYDDFWAARHANSYKRWGSRYYQYMVQGELLDIELLEGMLDDLVVRLGIQADGFGIPNNTAVVKEKPQRSLVETPFEETVPEAPTFRNSKQGYDIIAGFATDKKKANKLANQLKKLGSDAYIISKSGGYYISMGSAPTQTAAQAMENHIKTWYQGPVSIKNFNE